MDFDAQNLTSLPLWFTFCILFGMQNAARRLIVLHPKQNIEGELKWQTCFGTMPI